jgi:hypothetical protein
LRHLPGAKGIGFEVESTIFDLTTRNIAHLNAPIPDYRFISQKAKHPLLGIVPLDVEIGEAALQARKAFRELVRFVVTLVTFIVVAGHAQAQQPGQGRFDDPGSVPSPRRRGDRMRRRDFITLLELSA